MNDKGQTLDLELKTLSANRGRSKWENEDTIKDDLRAEVGVMVILAVVVVSSKCLYQHYKLK